MEPPLLTPQETVALATGLPFASFTTTENGVGSVAPAAANWLSPLTLAIWVGVGPGGVLLPPPQAVAATAAATGSKATQRMLPITHLALFKRDRKDRVFARVRLLGT
jgi:hypothetical protein